MWRKKVKFEENDLTNSFTLALKSIYTMNIIFLFKYLLLFLKKGVKIGFYRKVIVKESSQSSLRIISC